MDIFFQPGSSWARQHNSNKLRLMVGCCFISPSVIYSYIVTGHSRPDHKF